MASSEFDYKKYLQLIAKKKRLFVSTALAIMTIAIIVSYLLPTKYEAKSTVFIEKSLISDLVKGIAVTSTIEEKTKVLLYALNSRTLLTKVIDELDLNLNKNSEAGLEEMIREFQKNTDIRLKDKEGLFIISFTHHNPKVARDYVNALIRRYIEENVSAKREESYGATTFLSDQIKSFKEKLDKTESDANQFKQQKGAAISADPGTLQKEIAEAQMKLDELRIKRMQVETLIAQVKKNGPLKVKLTALEKRLDELRVEYTDDYPEVVRVKADIENAKEQLRANKTATSMGDSLEIERLMVELKAVKSSEDYQKNIIASSRAILREAPSARAELEKIEQERKNQQAIYDQLVTRHGQSEVSKQMEVQDKSTTFRVIDPAVTPIKPISPNRVKIILMGILAGLAGGIGILLLLDFLDSSVKSVDNLKSFGLPVLGVIPYIHNEDEIRIARRRDMKLYCVGGLYFSIILIILIAEALDVSDVYNLIHNLKLSNIASLVVSKFK